MTALLTAIKTFLAEKDLSIVTAHWEVIAAALAGLIFALAVLFAPSLERPLLLAGLVVALGLGVLIGRKYFGESSTPSAPSKPSTPKS